MQGVIIKIVLTTFTPTPTNYKETDPIFPLKKIVNRLLKFILKSLYLNDLIL